MPSKNSYYHGIGRRKESIATVRVYSSGTSGITINDRAFDEYFNHSSLQHKVLEPLKLLEYEGKYRITVKVRGGGLNSQAEAIRLGISNALVVMNEDLRSTLKRAGYLKRDSRVKERKKYGLKRARKAPQFTKR